MTTKTVGCAAVVWTKHTGQSCQGYAVDASAGLSKAQPFPLWEAQELCARVDDCNAVVCRTGNTHDCTLRYLSVSAEAFCSRVQLL